jgi:hypothetical protein
MLSVIKKNHWGVGIPKDRFLACAAKALADDERFAKAVSDEPGTVGELARTGRKPRQIQIGALTFTTIGEAMKWFGCQHDIIHRALRRGLFPVRVDVPCAYVEDK